MTMSTTDEVTPVRYNHGDAIRVVPVASVHEIGVATEGLAAAASPPKLTYRGGPLLGSVQVFTIFWGSAWAPGGSAADFPARINTFFDTILSGPLMDQLAEYSTTSTTIGHGKLLGTLTVTSPAPHKHVSDAGIQQFLQQQIASNAVPQPTPDTLYFVYTPPGTSITQGGSRSCQAFCGYHNDIHNGQIYYAAMPYPGCAGCTGGLAPFDALTSTTSHELCEAITDAIPGTGWYDDVNGEIGDICAWKSKLVQGYTVQLEWSNTANSCI
jgi:hypothetical protein